jgi:phospholipid/cholesterol/gamma-HCH transport system substrate-binding protein
MRIDEKKIEKRVGVFVLGGLFLALSALLILGGKSSFFTPMNHYFTHFNKVDGLVSGAKITLGGFKIGTVTKVELDPNTHDIRVSYSIERKYAEWIRKESSVELVTQGVLGDKYLSMVAGDPSQHQLENHAEIPQGNSKDLSMLMNSSERTSFNKGNRAEEFFQGLSTASKNLSEMSAKLNQELNQMKLKSAVNHLDSILEKIDHGQGSMGAFINDPALYDDAKALVGQANRNRIMRNLIRQTIKDNKDGKGDKTEE